jgi:hypothetical protein
MAANLHCKTGKSFDLSLDTPELRQLILRFNLLFQPNMTVALQKNPNSPSLIRHFYVCFLSPCGQNVTAPLIFSCHARITTIVKMNLYEVPKISVKYEKECTIQSLEALWYFHP